MLKKMAVTILLIGILTTGGLSIHANELKDGSFIGCTNISQNQETNVLKRFLNFL
ncbi:hypothetical protein ACQVPJ_17905 [Bacillus mycoides]|uniref:hypothetical protein n=1 Tax=Bacillus mycoides TaxID=1405 RepID=UPI001F454C3E|nr:hypothetical protein [Bacillus mycoides]MED1381415.1 hypothetical protein [Bacillus mycoides]